MACDGEYTIDLEGLLRSNHTEHRQLSVFFDGYDFQAFLTACIHGADENTHLPVRDIRYVERDTKGDFSLFGS